MRVKLVCGCWGFSTLCFRFPYFIFLCMSFCQHVCMCTMRVPGSHGDQKRVQIPLNWSHRWLWTTRWALGTVAPNQISRPSTLFCKMVFLTGLEWARMTGLFILGSSCLPALESKRVHHHPWLLRWCWGANTALCGCTASVLLSHLYSPSSTMWTFQSISRCLERIYLCVLANEKGVIHPFGLSERNL